MRDLCCALHNSGFVFPLAADDLIEINSNEEIKNDNKPCGKEEAYPRDSGIEEQPHPRYSMPLT